MKKEDIVKKICNCFDYNYKFFEDGRVVIDDGLGVDHKSTTEWTSNNFCGHLEYNSIDDMLLDWLDELKTVPNVFTDEIEFIKQMKIGGSSMQTKYYIVTFQTGMTVFVECHDEEEAEILAKAVMIKHGLSREIKSIDKTDRKSEMQTASFVG